MTKMRFRNFVEAADFGFRKPIIDSGADERFLSKPIRPFNVEVMTDLLSNKTIQGVHPVSHFSGEIQWGHEVGSVKLEVDSKLTFYVKKLGKDKLGETRWVTKKMLQMNRNGYGSAEDTVANDIFEHLEKAFHQNLDSPKESYKGLEQLVQHVYRKVCLSHKEIFVPVGVLKKNENTYIIKMEVCGSGVEARDQRRVEQNQTMIAYDPDQGTIRIFSYNIESPTGGAHEWKLMPNDLDLYFFPTQDREEIAECLAVHMRYY